jgi:hypothetical protein
MAERWSNRHFSHELELAPRGVSSGEKGEGLSFVLMLAHWSLGSPKGGYQREDQVDAEENEAGEPRSLSVYYIDFYLLP